MTAAPRPSDDETVFTRSLRFELADEENRALLGSYAISIGLAVAFLLLVYLGPKYEVPEAHRRSSGTTGAAVIRTSTCPSAGFGSG